MTPGLARLLTRCYPRSWRARYGVEFEDFLAEERPTLRTIGNVVGWAVVERLRDGGRGSMDARQRSLVLMAYAYLAVVAAGVNFCGSVDDTPVAAAMRSHVALTASYDVVAAGSIVALIAVLAVAARVVGVLLHTATAEQRASVIARVGVPCAMGGAVVTWMATAAVWAHGRWGGTWVPTPWDVAGDWPVPAGWPPLGVRVVLSSVTCLLLVVGLVASGMSVADVVRRTDLSQLRPSWFRATSIALAAGTVMMAAGLLAWGWFAEQYAPGPFHARNGGLFSLVNAASWMASALVFLVSAAVALVTARMTIALPSDSLANHAARTQG